MKHRSSRKKRQTRKLLKGAGTLEVYSSKNLPNLNNPVVQKELLNYQSNNQKALHKYAKIVAKYNNPLTIKEEIMNIPDTNLRERLLEKFQYNFPEKNIPLYLPQKQKLSLMNRAKKFFKRNNTKKLKREDGSRALVARPMPPKYGPNKYAEALEPVEQLPVLVANENKKVANEKPYLVNNTMNWK